MSDSGQWFDHPIADLTPEQRAALETALRSEGIPATFGPTLVRTDIAYEARVATLIDQARASARPTAEPPPPGSAPTMAPPATGYQPMYQPGVAPYGAPAGAPNNSNAVLALVLGIGSLVLGLSCGIGFFAGPFAVVIGQRARREISRTGEQGDGMALAGVITGAISSVLLALGLIALIVIIIVAVAAGN